MQSELPLYEATVVTGLESIAADECRQRLNVLHVRTEQGRIAFQSDVHVKCVLSLRGVDNVSVVLYKRRHTLPNNKDDLRPLFEEIERQCDWKTGLSVWKNTFDFQEYDLDVALSGSEDENLKRPAFRVTCNRAGDRHCFGSPDAACIFGGVINDTYHWPVSMKHFDVEVILNIKNDEITVAISLTRESLCFRNLVSFGVTTLRSTICHNMLRLANIEVGDIICDPMCGSGAISVESVISWPHGFNVAGDNHPKAIENTTNNMNQLFGRTEIMEMDATRLPFNANSIDVFITDLPFGKRVGSKRDNRVLYPAALKEMARCARLGTGRAVLLTQDKKNLGAAIEQPSTKQFWRRSNYVFVKVGGLAAGIYCLNRTDSKFT